MAVAAHSEIEEDHFEIVEEVRFGIGVVHSGIVEDHFGTEVAHFEIGVADHFGIAEEERSGNEEVVHFDNLEEGQIVSLAGNSVHQEAGMAEAVESLGCSGTEVLLVD